MSPAFNRLWAGSIISNLADGVLIAAAPLLAITLTDSTVLISIIGAMVMLPWLLFAMPIGVMVDRVDRRFILAGSNAIRSAVIGIMALGIATGHVTIYWLIFSAFIIGVCEVATDTTAQSLIPQILDEEHYEKGNSRLHWLSSKRFLVCARDLVALFHQQHRLCGSNIVSVVYSNSILTRCPNRKRNREKASLH